MSILDTAMDVILRLDAQGRYRWFLARATAMHDAHGKIERWYGTCTDIDVARTFYRDTLGLAVADGEMGTLELGAANGAKVLVYPKPDHEPAAPPVTVGKDELRPAL